MTEEEKEELCKIGEDEFQHLSESYYNLHEKYYNLQQKVNQLKQEAQLKEKVKELENVIVTDDFNFAKPILKEYVTQILKSRIDKATEYINNNWDGSSYTDATLKSKVAELNITELLEILRGGSNE